MRVLATHARFFIYTMVLALLLLAPFVNGRAHAAELDNRSVQLSDSQAGASSVQYQISSDVTANSLVGSYVIEFCDNNPFPGLSCNAPSGFNAASANITFQFGITNFSIGAGSTANKVVLVRPAAANFGPGTIRVVLNNMTNPSVGNSSFYVRLMTYATTDATGAFNNSGGVALAVNESFTVSATVPPYLYFCVATTISGYDCNSAVSLLTDFGEFSTNSPKTATSQMIVGTNADFGVSVSINGTTLTSGNSIIPPLASQTASITGVSQFGINLRANSNPGAGQDPVGPGNANPTPEYNTPNVFRFASGDAVVSASDVVDYRKFTTTYLVNIAKSQKPGTYTTTLTYIALANF